jgi:hypothetical protein
VNRVGSQYNVHNENIAGGLAVSTVERAARESEMLLERITQNPEVVGAVEYFIRNYYGDTQAKAFCESLGADLRAGCLRTAEEYYRSFNPG